MKVYVNGNEIELDKSSFVAAGGEGQIYAKGQTAYKIYLDPKHTIPQGKIQELSKITDSDVNKPIDIVMSSKNKPIGYTTKFVKHATPLCAMFPKAFRDRSGITPEMTVSLVKRLRDMINNIHQAQILVVDLNEMNFLLNTKLDKIYAIDVDSYQTPHFKATAIMDTIRDRHSATNVFNEGTDWFAFAITSFQMFRGVHPYKGRHATLKGLDERMLANISVLHKDVSVPNAVLPITVIPNAYLDWYRAVLDDGKRVPPPTDMQPVFIVTQNIQTLVGNGNIIITEMNYKITEKIKGVFAFNNFVSIISDNMLYNNGRPGGVLTSSDEHLIVFSTKTNEPILVKKDGLNLCLRHGLTKEIIPSTITVDTITEYNGRLIVKSNDKIYEITLSRVGKNTIASANIIGNVLPHATKLYSGVAIQNLLGSTFLSLFPDKGSCYQVRVPELDNYKIIEAKFDSGVLMIIGAHKNRYDRIVLRFTNDYSKYDIRYVKDITNVGLNFVTLDETGICVCLNEDGNIEAFSSKINSSTIKLVNDSALSNDMRLFKMGEKVGFYLDNKLYTIKMA